MLCEKPFVRVSIILRTKILLTRFHESKQIKIIDVEVLPDTYALHFRLIKLTDNIITNIITMTYCNAIH